MDWVYSYAEGAWSGNQGTLEWIENPLGQATEYGFSTPDNRRLTGYGDAADHFRERRERQDRESVRRVGMKFIPYALLGKSMLRNIGPSPNPPPFVSPFPPMPKGPFLGGGQAYIPG